MQRFYLPLKSIFQSTRSVYNVWSSHTF